MFSGKDPDCVKCGFTIVIPENYQVVNLIDTYMNFFLDGMGSLNVLGIDKVLDWEEITDKIPYANRIQFYLVHYMNEKNSASSEVMNHGKTGVESNVRSDRQRFGKNNRRR